MLGIARKSVKSRHLVCVRMPNQIKSQFFLERTVCRSHHKSKPRLLSTVIDKQNQASVSDADREIHSLGSKDKAGNSVNNRVSGMIRLTRGLGFLGLHWRPMLNYF